MRTLATAPHQTSQQSKPASPDYTQGPRQCLHVEELGRTWLLNRTGDLEIIWENMSREEFAKRSHFNKLYLLRDYIDSGAASPYIVSLNVLKRW